MQPKLLWLFSQVKHKSLFCNSYTYFKCLTGTTILIKYKISESGCGLFNRKMMRAVLIRNASAAESDSEGEEVTDDSIRPSFITGMRCTDRQTETFLIMNFFTKWRNSYLSHRIIDSFPRLLELKIIGKNSELEVKHCFCLAANEDVFSTTTNHSVVPDVRRNEVWKYLFSIIELFYIFSCLSVTALKFSMF